MISVIPHRRAWYTLSSVLTLASLVVIVMWRFNFGIDFTGGSLIELRFPDARPESQTIAARVQELGASRVKVQTAGERSVIIRTAPLVPEVRQAIVTEYATSATVERTESIGPSIGRELARKTILAVILAIVGIILYVAWAFRKVGREVPSFVYGTTAIVALAHDVLIPMGLFAVLGRFSNVEVDAPFIAAVLTILGYSVNDTIIIFDRVRENLTTLRGKPFAEVVEASVHQSFARSINTTLTTLIALLAVVLLGGTSVRSFALALMVGIGIGAYSSIFIAAPLLVTWYERKQR